MKILIISLLLLNIAYANKNCTYSLDKTNTKISWKAFKTPKKVGVGGSFTQFEISSFPAKNVENLLQSASFVIDPASTVTGDKGRDMKIVKFFFGSLAADGFIKGLVKKVEVNKLTVTLYMNGVAKDEVLTLKNSNNESFIATGNIDVLNYSMQGQLAAINKACYALHEGKTWSDVEIQIEAKTIKKCDK
jgi:polyisoprenoid-binding protein YceI